jgi:hypothetical protein
VRFTPFSVCVVGNTNHIAALGEQLGVFGKFVNGGKKHPAAVAAFEQFAQLGSALYTHHRLVTNVTFGIGKLTRELIVQIGAVGNQH